MKNKKPPESESTSADGKRILVVDDDYYFRLILEKALTQSRFEPICAENVKQAQNMIGLEEFDLVLSDIRMPDATGIDLLQWIRANHSMPVILMTGFSEIVETQEAAKLGADGFLAKPFKKDELLQAIEACFPDKPAEDRAEEDLDSQFCKISIDDFISGKEMRFDIFIRITETKYIKIAHSGENIEPDRIQTYKSKGISFLYMTKDDFRKYLDFNLAIAQAVTKSQKVTRQKKVGFIKHATEVMVQNLYVNEMTRQEFLQAGTLVENAVSLLSDNEAALDLLTALSNHTDFLYAHSVGVSLYSAMIGKALGWSSPTTILKLSMGGLLHDIGKKEISKEVLNKPRNELTSEEIALLETHPARGAEILASLQCVPTDILQITHEHHENCLGFGYPAHLPKNKIHPLAKVVSVANDFCNFVIKNPNSAGMNPVEAARRLTALNPEYYDRTVLEALVQIFSLPSSEVTTSHDSVQKKAA